MFTHFFRLIQYVRTVLIFDYCDERKRKCMIKIFPGGGRGGDIFRPPPPYEQLLPLPTPVLRCFWKDPLMTPTTPLQASFTGTPSPYTTPSPPPPPPLKILIIHKRHSVRELLLRNFCTLNSLCIYVNQIAIITSYDVMRLKIKKIEFWW